MSTRYLIIAISIMAVVTYATRVFPLILCRSKIKKKYIKSFLLYMPFGVLAAMIFPGILFSTSTLASSIVGMCVALVLSYLKKGLLPVAAFSCLSVFITEMIMKYL